MPELPEVETIRRGLERHVVGLTIATSTVAPSGEKCFPNAASEVARSVYGATIEAVERRGKLLILPLSTNYALLIHLKMTGQVVFRGAASDSFAGGHPNDSLVGALPDRSTRVTLTFTNGSTLFFNDQRKFGWVKVVRSTDVARMPYVASLGPEPLAPSFTPEVLRARLARRPSSLIKAALLDQTVVAGIGNIYADESLWGARIHPATRVRLLGADEITALHGEIIYILQLSLEKGGSTDKTYVDAEGRRGSYLEFARVFRREGLPCPRCGAILQKTRVAGRGTHSCPVCQQARDSKLDLHKTSAHSGLVSDGAGVAKSSKGTL